MRVFHLASIDYIEDLVTYNAADHNVEQALITLKKGLQVLIWISSSGEKRLKLASVSKIVPRQRTVRRYSSFSCESVLFGSCSEASGLNTVSFKAVFYVVKLHPSFCFFCFFNFSGLAKLSVTC